MRSAYWLLSDDRLDLCRVPEQFRLFTAHFKHSLLFNPELSVPDSYIVNNYNFRRTLSQDETVRGLGEDQVLRVLTRATGEDEGKTLVQIRDEMPRDKIPREFTREEYPCNDDLAFVDRVAQRGLYRLDAVSRRSAVKAVEVFRSTRAATGLGGKITTSVARFAQEAAGLDDDLEVLDEARLATFGRAYFHYELSKDFKRVTGQNWADYENRIPEFANAPYLTALPSVLDPVTCPRSMYQSQG